MNNMQKVILAVLSTILILIILPLILLWFVWQKTFWKKSIKWLVTIFILALSLSLLFWVTQNFDRQIRQGNDDFLRKKVEELKGKIESERQKKEELSRLLELEKNVATQDSGDKNVSFREESYVVKRAIDGDTIELENGEVVRYIGIDAPEAKGVGIRERCFGKLATQKNRELVEGKIVKIVRDVSQTDKYNRLLRYVYVGDVFVNDYLVRNGYAYAASFPPDVKYRDQFRQAQSEARLNKRGLWKDGSCDL